MNWYYMDEDRQIGPVTEEVLGILIEAGKFTEDTLVWNETMTEWTRLIDSGLIEIEVITSPTIKDTKQSLHTSAPEHQYSAIKSPNKSKYFFIIISVTVLIVFGLITIRKLTASSKNFSSELPQQTKLTNEPIVDTKLTNEPIVDTKLTNEPIVDNEDKLFDSSAALAYDDYVGPLGSRLNIIMQFLNDDPGRRNRTDGLYTAPFGLAITPGLPSGFKDAVWGESLDQMRQRLGTNVLEQVYDGKNLLTVFDAGRTITYNIDEKMGFYRVKIHYPLYQSQELLDALIKQFGKVPKHHIRSTFEDDKPNGTIIEWLDDNTHIVFLSKVTKAKQVKYQTKSSELSVTFESRYLYNYCWKESLHEFLDNYIPRCGARPIFNNLHWGITQEEVLLLTDKKDNTKRFYVDFTSGNYLNNVSILIAPYNLNKSTLVFDGEKKLKACFSRLGNLSSSSPEITMTKLTIILGNGKIYTPQEVLPGYDIIDGREWKPWNDILVRCVTTHSQKEGVFYTFITYGKHDFLSHFDTTTEITRAILARPVDKRFKF